MARVEPPRAAEAQPPLPTVRGLGGGGGGGRSAGRPIERPQRTGETLARLFVYFGRQRAALLVCACSVVAMVGLDLTGPLLLRHAIDRHVVPRELEGLAPIALVMLGVYGASAALNLLQGYVMAGAAQRTMRDLRGDLFSKLERLPLGFFDSRPHGELMARLTSDVESVNQVLSSSVSQLVSGGLSTLAIAVTMCAIHPLLGAFSVLTVGSLTLGLNRWLARKNHARYRLQQAALGRLYGFTEETIGSQKVVKAYGREPMVIERFEGVSGEYREAGIRSQSLSGLTGPLMNTVNNTALTIVAGAGGLLAIGGSVTIGTIATFINYTRQFGRPLNEIAHLYNALQAALAGAERIFEILDEPAEVDAPAPTEARRLRGEVVFEDVSFSYRKDVPVLTEVSFRASPGQTVALVGPTGAGKTTLVNLLTRFYEIDSGRILVDGVDLRQYNKEHLRRQLGIVLQDTFLFAGTVRDNIRYGRLEATDEEVERAARWANAHTFIHRLPHGYDTVLTERGSNLSHGQRQMLAIARAILADPALLILDEATSSIDTRTEKHIQEAMQRLLRGRTSFVIAHRLNTVQNADQILTIEGGRVVERRARDDKGRAPAGLTSAGGLDVPDP